QTAERDKELACSDSFVDFLAGDLLPWMHKYYGVNSGPARTIACGGSRGGLTAAYCGYRHPDVFGNVLSISGSFWWFQGADQGVSSSDAEPGWLTRQFVAKPASN